MATTMPTNSSNPYNVQLSERYDPTSIGPGAALTYHGMSIAYNSTVIGRIKEWTPKSYSRDGTFIYELNMYTWGRPVDYVPGKMGEPSISFTRVEMWEKEIEKELGYGKLWVDLMDQNTPFSVFEHLYKGTVPYRVWEYLGCWFRNKEYSGYSGDGDGIISVDCEIAYIRKRSVL
jgi:hypothetical protein